MLTIQVLKLIVIAEHL